MLMSVEQKIICGRCFSNIRVVKSALQSSKRNNYPQVGPNKVSFTFIFILDLLFDKSPLYRIKTFSMEKILNINEYYK
jgi:hypothetical protein